MPYLTINEDDDKSGGKPIALIRGGDLDANILYLHDDDKKDKKIIKSSKKTSMGLSQKEYEAELKAMSLKPKQRIEVMNKLTEAKRKGLKPKHLMEDPDVVSLYERIVSDDKEKEGTMFELPDDSSFEILPNCDKTKRDIGYLGAMAGSGKSYMARAFAEKYRKLWPDREVYLISQLAEDETLDKMKGGPPTRIKVETIVEDFPELTDFENCLVIFDDFDTYPDEILNPVLRLIDLIAIQGRHTITSMLVLTHYLTNYKKTRLILNEATFFVVYPQSTSFKALQYLLGTHLGLDKEDLARIKKLGRWCVISKNYPQYMISQHFTKILHQ